MQWQCHRQQRQTAQAHASHFSLAAIKAVQVAACLLNSSLPNITVKEALVPDDAECTCTSDMQREDGAKK